MTGGRMRVMLIGTLLLGVSSGATINNLAAAPLSLIAHDFATTPARITIVASASGFALACCMPVAGWMGVRWGSRRTLVGAFLLLGIGCLLAGLAPSVPVLIAARVIQGVAMSVVPPTVMHVLPAVMGVERRERALGWWAVANGAGTAAGAPLGAVIADTVGWRAMFLMFVPMCLLLALACCWISADAERNGRLDGRSAGLLTAALVLLIAPTMSATTGLPTWLLWGSAATGVVAALLFLRRNKRSVDPFVEPRFMRSRGFIVGSLGGISQMFVLGSTSVLVPLLVVQRYDLSVRSGGVLVLVITAVMMLSAPPISGAVAKVGANRMVLCGLAVTTLALLFAGLAIVNGAAIPVVVGTLLLVGLGLGLLQSPSAITVSGEASSRGAGVGLYNSLRFSGGVVGIGWLSLAALVDATAEQAIVAAALPVALSGIVVLTVLRRGPQGPVGSREGARG